GDPRAPLRLRDPRVAATLAHEALHVWQRTRGVWVTARGAVLQTGYALRLGNPYRYEPSEDPAELLERFVRGNVEQQGQIFEDYVRAQRSGADTRAFVAVAAHVRGEH
ncbi:MAG TPA: hypothetical protein VHM19_03860, partial [Polyangiales bacterium]|nr:hypothetical protein [Polyangiales bacterium]